MTKKSGGSFWIPLIRQKHRPGDAVQRFGDWRRGEITVLIDNQTWLNYGKPDTVEVRIENPNEYMKINE